MNPSPPEVSRPLFRIRTDMSLNYVELVLGRRVDGQIRIVDLFDLRRGGLQSEDGRATLLPSPPLLKILNDMLAPTPEDFLMEEDPAFMELLELFKRKAHGELDALFVEKKDAFKTSRKSHRLHISSAAQVDADAYLRAVREMKKCFPDDTSVLLLELEGAIAKHDLKGILESADALERRVKRDPYLDMIRAQAHLSAGDPSGARPLAAKATDAEPDFQGGWWLLVEICLAQKDFKAVAEALSKIEEKLGLEIGDLESSPAYAEFVKSKEYRLWRGAR